MAQAIYDYKFRLIVIGDTNTGKSSLIRFFRDRKPINPTAQHRPTVGADFSVRVIQAAPKCDTRVQLEVWDTAGQERYRSITKSYYRNSIGVVLVFDITNRESFEHIPQWYEDCQIHILPHKAVYILVGNKIDLPDRKVTKDEAEAFAMENGMSYVETSCVTGQKIDVGFTDLGQAIFSKLRSGEIRVESGWEGVKDHFSADQKVKLSASNRNDSNYGGTRCG